MPTSASARKTSSRNAATQLPSFAQRLVTWQKQHGRHHLPWQNTHDAYRIWLSEIMLQQTQVATVINYYQRFLESFPDVQALAAAPLSQVLGLWSGLGYYRRAHHLHAAAQRVVEHFGGAFPDTQEALATLPGVGRSTAAAVAIFAFNRRAAILDGNVRRIFARHQGIEEFTGTPAVEKRLWVMAEQLLPAHDLIAYTQGLMDLGSQLCTRSKPACTQCPLRDDCIAYRHDRTHELPAPHPDKKVTRRDFAVLMLWQQQRVLLETRHQQSIWSGLWSFPECNADDDIAALLRERWGLTATEQTTLPPIVHKLTHRTFHITPIRITVRGRLRAEQQGDEESRFFTLAEARDCGLPAPIRQLLAAED